MERTPRARVRMRSSCAQRAAYHRAQRDSYASMAPKIAVVREGDGENGSCNGGRGLRTHRGAISGQRLSECQGAHAARSSGSGVPGACQTIPGMIPAHAITRARAWEGVRAGQRAAFSFASVRSNLAGLHQEEEGGGPQEDVGGDHGLI